MTSVFFSYSHADSEFRDQLEKHLAMLKRQQRIDTWHDRKIVAGDPLDNAISEYLRKSEVVLLLVSSDFLASEYCYGVEVQEAIQRSDNGDARVIPVILRPCDWHSTPFGNLLATPTDGKPVSRWADRDEAWLDVVQAIKRAIPESNPRTESVRTVPPGDGPFVRKQRSSNLRIRREFSDAERRRFLKDTFEFIVHFFENSLAELRNRHPEIDSDFTR